MENDTQNIGAVGKLGNFLGIRKFGQGLATAGRVLTGGVKRDIEAMQANDAAAGKVLYAAKQEKDPAKKAKLLQIAQSMGQQSLNMSPANIDPGLNLTNKEILGSAANVGLNILTPGAFKGGKAAILAKNAALGAGFGAASGLEKKRSAGGIVGSTVGGAVVGGALGGATLATRWLKDFATVTTPKWLMDKAIKPTLDEARKTIKFGQKSFGEELLQEGVKGGPQKLLQIAENKLNTLEDDLQRAISHPSLSEVRITRKQITPYLNDLVETKSSIPGLGGDVKAIKGIIQDLPERMTLEEANQIKRRIYAELRDVAYKLDAKLGVKGKALKQIARGLKTEIENAVGGNVVSDINQKLGLYGRLEDRITDQMARSMRNNSFGLTDAILTSGGLATMSPLGLLAALGATGAKRAIGSTAFRTGAAQALSQGRNIGTGAIGKIISEGARRGILNIP